MNYKQAINLLYPFHNAKLVAVYVTETGLNGQLSTGLADQPFISVNDNQIIADDLYDVLELWANLSIPFEFGLCDLLGVA